MVEIKEVFGTFTYGLGMPTQEDVITTETYCDLHTDLRYQQDEAGVWKRLPDERNKPNSFELQGA